MEELEYKKEKIVWKIVPSGLSNTPRIHIFKGVDFQEFWQPSSIGNITEDTKRNAKLIAAAPQMLTALLCEQALDRPNRTEGIKTLEFYGYEHKEKPQDFVDSLRIQAIKKATL